MRINFMAIMLKPFSSSRVKTRPISRRCTQSGFSKTSVLSIGVFLS